MRVPVMLFLLICSLGCQPDHGKKSGQEDKPGTEMAFDAEKWKVKQGPDYPFRDKMYHDVLYGDLVRSLKMEEILDLLGEPDRINENHLYYRIAQERQGFFPLHTKTLVIKISAEDAVEWIKIHQ